MIINHIASIPVHHPVSIAVTALYGIVASRDLVCASSELAQGYYNQLFFGVHYWVEIVVLFGGNLSELSANIVLTHYQCATIRFSADIDSSGSCLATSSVRSWRSTADAL